jgi:AcrR family transcriptional regulator
MPRPQTVQDDELLVRLAEVFRRTGFEGASLGALAEAAQLRRASLYHRFPDGKAQMAEAVLNRVEMLLAEVLEPMRGMPDVTDGVAETARRIGDFYGGGLLPCVLDTLTLAGTPDSVRARAAAVATTWIDAMAAAAVRGGCPPDEARNRAEDAFARLEGGLVFGRLFEESTAFQRAAADLPRQLLGGSPPA